MLISAELPTKTKVQFRVRLTESVIKEIDAYCQWAGIRFRDYFIEKACMHIFKQDTEWLGFRKNNLVVSNA